MKGRKNKKKLKIKRFIQKKKEAYLNILACLFIGFFTTMYSTFDEIISKKTFFCQENYFLILSAVVVLILLFKFNKILDKKVDIKNFNKTLVYGSYAFVIFVATDILSCIL